ncbi:Trm112 family protein [Edaphobacter sp. DSM 109919]|uniref:Trm112 family protein n=1 Tax=Edaphobacter paludis TaxID=3035702 RepID=A0AAU7CWG0_9BACT
MSTRPMTPEDLRWIVCPVCHHPLEPGPDSVLCTGCGRRYPFIDGIPVLLADRAL